MGLLDRLRRFHGSGDKHGIRVRCGMCSVVTWFPAAKAGAFVKHSCDCDILVAERDEASEAEALDLFVKAFGAGPPAPLPMNDESAAARDRLLYDLGEAPVPGLEDLLYRLKYETAEAFPPPEIASRTDNGNEIPRIDWSNFLEMSLHRMKKFAITRRMLELAEDSVKPILRDKLERLKTEELKPIEE